MATEDKPQAAAGESVITPEERLRRVAAHLQKISQRRRQNGRGKAHTYVGAVDELASTGAQLADEILAYLEGTLEPIKDDGLPF